MVALGVCSGCQLGDHSLHQHVIQAVPKGMYGGVVCKCQGECKDGRYEPEINLRDLEEALEVHPLRRHDWLDRQRDDRRIT